MYSHHQLQTLTLPVSCLPLLRGTRPHGIMDQSTNPRHNEVVLEALTMALEIHREFEDIISRIGTEENSDEAPQPQPTNKQ